MVKECVVGPAVIKWQFRALPELNRRFVGTEGDRHGGAHEWAVAVVFGLRLPNPSRAHFAELGPAYQPREALRRINRQQPTLSVS
jgi:hypothetical protein